MVSCFIFQGYKIWVGLQTAKPENDLRKTVNLAILLLKYTKLTQHLNIWPVLKNDQTINSF